MSGTQYNAKQSVFSKFSFFLFTHERRNVFHKPPLWPEFSERPMGINKTQKKFKKILITECFYLNGNKNLKGFQT